MAEVELLIDNIEKYPCLWDIKNADYHNRDVKDIAWEKVFKEIFVEWDILDPTEKKKKRDDTKRKWANIRDNYRRDFNKTKNIPSGANKKRYTYSEYLSFLNPVFETKCRDGNCGNSNNSDPLQETTVDQDSEGNIETQFEPRPAKRKKKDISIQILDILNTKKATRTSDHEDDDTKFLLSFRSELKEMTKKQKRNFKAGMCELLQRVTDDTMMVEFIDKKFDYS